MPLPFITCVLIDSSNDMTSLCSRRNILNSYDSIAVATFSSPRLGHEILIGGHRPYRYCNSFRFLPQQRVSPLIDVLTFNSRWAIKLMPILLEGKYHLVSKSQSFQRKCIHRSANGGLSWTNFSHNKSSSHHPIIARNSKKEGYERRKMKKEETNLWRQGTELWGWYIMFSTQRMVTSSMSTGMDARFKTRHDMWHDSFISKHFIGQYCIGCDMM